MKICADIHGVSLDFGAGLDKRTGPFRSVDFLSLSDGRLTERFLCLLS